MPIDLSKSGLRLRYGLVIHDHKMASGDLEKFIPAVCSQSSHITTSPRVHVAIRTIAKSFCRRELRRGVAEDDHLIDGKFYPNSGPQIAYCFLIIPRNAFWILNILKTC